MDEDFKDKIEKFYINLEKNQKHLGDDFEKILYDNFYDLIENENRDDTSIVNKK